MFKHAIFAAALFAAAAPAAAVNFSFTGTLPTANTVQFFDFTVGAASNVTLRTWSYAGGVNAAGATIARGGFDPILAVFALPGGAKVGENDDGGDNVAADTNGARFDTFLNVALTAGTYRASVAAYPNFSNGSNLADGFAGGASFGGGEVETRSANWAFDVMNVEGATQNAIPEPASWAMLIAGFGLTGAVMRRRRSAVAA